MEGGFVRSGRYEVRRATLLDLIKTAYNVDSDTISGGPDWLDWDRFDIVAKTPPSTSPETARLMLQTLLADRFKLVLHNDTKPMPAFVLRTNAGRVKLKEADAAGDSGCRAQPPPPPPPPPGSGVLPVIEATCRNVTMAAFAPTLREIAADYIAQPVIDLTGLKGTWDFDLKWTPRGPLQGAGAGVSVFDAIEKELGLKLELQKVPMPVLVVDMVNQKPTTNPAGAAAILPQLRPAEFEVASIRPSLADGPPPLPPDRQFQFQPGGRLNLRSVPLRDLIIQAFDLDPDPHAELVGAPDWLDSVRFDVAAEAGDAIAGKGGQLFSDDLQTMLQPLLIDRFKLAYHYEDRLVDTYTLIGLKPKLKKADPGNRPACKSGRSQTVRDSADGPPPDEITCTNVTMAQFAERLQAIGRSYLRYPVVDSSGINGAWDITLTFNPAPPPNRGPGGRGGPQGPLRGGGSADGLAPDPISGTSLFVALQKQLGLRLEPHKRMMPIFVIDHIEPKPTDN